jgi:hypothetical protein
MTCPVKNSKATLPWCPAGLSSFAAAAEGVADAVHRDHEAYIREVARQRQARREAYLATRRSAAAAAGAAMPPGALL